MTAEQAGDPGARDDVGERLASQVEWLRLALLHLAGRAVRAHAELDDLVQETLLRALGTRGGLPPSEAGETALRRLLAHLARHVVVDVARRLRADKRSGRVVRLSRADWSASGLSDSALPAATAGPFTRAAAADERRALEQAFLGLSPEHRRVLRLRRFLGLDARETARRMGRSESAVHSLYRRALAAWADARDVP